MRLLLLPAPLLLLAMGCATESPFTGTYDATIAEGGNPPVHVSLEISGKEDGPLKGTLTIQSDPGTELGKGEIFDLVDVRADGDRLSFILAITGQVDDDASVAELRREGDHLVGTMRERREGKKPFAVEFRRTK